MKKKLLTITILSIMIIALTGCETRSQSVKTNNNTNNNQSSQNTNVSYTNVETIYFNPETGKKCDDYVKENSTNENKTGCMRWYLYSDNGNGTVNLLLDHNTTYNIAWNSTGSNLNGPKEVLEQLKNDTSSWKGVKERTDTYINKGTYKDENDDYEVKDRNYTINYKGYRARLITAQEIADATGFKDWDEVEAQHTNFSLGATELNDYQNTSNNELFYWLFNNTSGCEAINIKETDVRNGCDMYDKNTSGYWTSSGLYEDFAFGINHVRGRSAELNGFDVSWSFGVRPVITIDKSIIK